MDKSVIAAPTTQTNPGSIERLALIFSAMVLAGLCLWTWWPGILTWDSEDQLTQALSGSFTDWHPPIMAWIWSYLLALGPGGTPLFLLHVGLYWFSVSLVAVTLSQAGHHRLAWVTLAIAALPPFFALNGHVLKDIGMCVSLLGAFSVVFRYASRGRQLPWYALAFVLLLCAYGMLVRVNGVFAAAPLLVYMFVRTRGWSVLRVALLIAVITVVWIPLEGAINHRVLHAAVDYPIRALKAFDVAGTARFSGDLSVFPADARITADLLARCYTPVQWDPLDKGECTPLAKYPLQTREQIMYLARHPVAYLTHRIQNFNRASMP